MKEGLDATRALFADIKIKPAYCGLPVSATGPEENYKKGMDGLEEAAKFANAIGCNRMTSVMPSGTRADPEELRKTAKERLTAIGQVLARNNIRLGLEFLGPLHIRSNQPHEFIWRMNDMLAFAKECGPNIGLLLDAWHWHHAGATVDDIIKAGKSRIVVVHVADAAKKTPEEVRDNERLMPGEGVINLVGFFQALKKIGYTDSVSPEPLGRVPRDTPPEEGAKLGLETTLAVMKKAGVA
jgi:sugar phosphate isomerase/epimerase